MAGAEDDVSRRAVIETERLVLRELAPGDLDQLAAILGDPETMRFYPAPYGRDQVVLWIERNQRRYREDGFGLWGLDLKETGELVGDCGLTIQEVEGAPFMEVGYHVKKARWRQGLATEAALACRDHAFDVLGIDRLIALIRPENSPSRGVAERIGMTAWKPTVHRDIPHLVYAITRDEWVSARS